MLRNRSHRIVMFRPLCLCDESRKPGGTEGAKQRTGIDIQRWLVCERGHGGTRPRIHYQAVSNIIIQAHVRWAVRAVGRSLRMDRNVSAERACDGR